MTVIDASRDGGVLTELGAAPGTELYAAMMKRERRLSRWRLVFLFMFPLLCLLGVYNIITLGMYFVEVWRSLHQQGMGHLYLVIVSCLSFWWLGLAAIGCFGGSYSAANEELRSHFKGWLMIVAVTVMSVFLPTLMLSLWFIGITWFHSLL